MQLEGKTALVTGAGRGIGWGCAIELARRGADVVANDVPGGTGVADTAEQIRALGRTCTVIEAEVFSRRGCERLVSSAIEATGRIDILISNPAWTVRDDFLNVKPDDFERVVQCTLTGGFHMSQLVTRHMVERGGGGKIVFISSIHAEVPYARSVAYNAAKAGMINMAKTIALELLPHRINVNCIEPGWIDTPGERAFYPEEQLQAAGATLPWGRMGVPADIGKAAAFLASDDADYITGEVLRVDGGLLFQGTVE